MVKPPSRAVVKGVSKKLLSELLVCPLSKQPLRECGESNALISDALGVSYPVVNGIPHLVPKDGKLLDTHNDVESDDLSTSAVLNHKVQDDH
ncbi:uncharacterized protein LOC18436620 [Amborella trichopoda]|uniref:Protein preY, mitochondrial n=1 Tax=Amborella trichopoda TaxID=13333 RepID=W1PEU4_AMBTC|nr:uncharacterized protein LOC18436620 [Amborella trichopoda]ERN08492.1 hypothetical protein AMTR_s00152p00055700 [Amborella trichopoda]|eukprot:XP_006846911.1 uncharacterized protein LOC18436620 [Amborella trichopoda]